MATPNYPGDDVIPDANMVYNQTITIPGCEPRDVFPWLVQLGAGRAGWYLPFSIEKWLVSPSSRASRVVRPEWTDLHVGQKVYDYKMPFFDKERPWFEVVRISPPSERELDSDGSTTGSGCLVYRSERYGTVFSWTLMAHREDNGPNDDGSQSSSGATTVHLRFRGKIASTGLKEKMIVWGGGVMDYLSTAPMLAGLKERVLETKRKHGD